MRAPEDLSGTHSRDPFRPTTKRKLSGLASPSAAVSGTSFNLTAADLDLRSRVKRQKTTFFLPLSHGQESMSKVSVVAGRDVGFGHSNFQLHKGVRKLVVKNLRKAPVENLENHYNGILEQLALAMNCIFSDQRPKTPLERLYRDVEDICRNDQAELLYQQLENSCKKHMKVDLLQPILFRLGNGFATLDTLRNVRQSWQNWTAQSLQIRSIFSYLDRSYLLNSKAHPQLNDMAIELFRTIICQSPEITSHLYTDLNALVELDRTNRENEFDPILLKDSVMMLHILELYRPRFEPSFLKDSRAFFKARRWENVNLAEYIANCVQLLNKEGERCDTFNFDSATKRALLIDAQLILVKDRCEILLDNDGVAGLLEANDIGSLKSLHGLLKASEMQDRLKIPWEEYIKRAGASIVNDQDKGDEIVVRLLELKRSLDVVTRDAFNKDETFKFSMREAYSNFINDRKNTTSWGTGTSKVGEVIAKYIDLLLRGGLKAVPRSLASDAADREEAEKQGQASTGDEDAELDRQLEQGLELFRFIEGKDVFEAFYKKDLARRLLMARSASQDAERSMLTKLKSECGSNFTHNLEQMFKDQELSRDEMISYKQSLSSTSKNTMDLQVSVLSAAAWPTYPDVKVNLPADVAYHIERFDRHYKNKHTGRRLTWKHSLAHSVVKANFNKGAKELIVSGFQALVLILFNDISTTGNLSYADIQTATSLIDAELSRTLQSLACAKIRILTKHPKGRDVAKTDTFTINLGFTDPKFRIKINQIQLKETKEENKETHERVAMDRQYETQAAIVRIMKSRKVMTHPNLVAEVIDQTKSRGAVELGEIKKNIEKLIEKDYIERDGSSYTYLA